MLAEELGALRDAKQAFAVLAGLGEQLDNGIYGVGIGKIEGTSQFCISVNGTEEALAKLPDTYEGFPVRKRVGGPAIAL